MTLKKENIIFTFLSSLLGGLTSASIFFYNMTLVSPFCGVKFSSISGRLTLVSGCIFLVTFILVLFLALKKIKFWFVRTLFKVTAILTVVVILGLSIVMLLVSNNFQESPRLECGSIMPIGGRSMMPGINDGDSLWFTSTKYLDNFSRGLIVIVTGNYFEDKSIVKRVIGLPGETIKYNGLGVWVNNNQINEPYAMYDPTKQLPFQLINKYTEITIPTDSYFVLGDNRNHSADSRTFGVVKRKDINLFREDKYSEAPFRLPATFIFGLKDSIFFGYLYLTISASLLCFSLYVFICFVKRNK